MSRVVPEINVPYSLKNVKPPVFSNDIFIRLRFSKTVCDAVFRDVHLPQIRAFD